MAVSFDAHRLDLANYQLADPIDAIRYQDTVKDFLALVRNDPGSLIAKPVLLAKFCTFLNHDDGWQLASMVGPELRHPQSYDTSANTLMDRILVQLVDRRPATPLADPTSHEEKLLVKRRIREAIEYVETEGRGAHHATAEEINRVDDLAERASAIVGKLPPKNFDDGS